MQMQSHHARNACCDYSVRQQPLRLIERGPSKVSLQRHAPPRLFLVFRTCLHSLNYCGGNTIFTALLVGSCVSSLVIVLSAVSKRQRYDAETFTSERSPRCPRKRCAVQECKSNTCTSGDVWPLAIVAREWFVALRLLDFRESVFALSGFLCGDQIILLSSVSRPLGYLSRYDSHARISLHVTVVYRSIRRNTARKLSPHYFYLLAHLGLNLCGLIKSYHLAHLLKQKYQNLSVTRCPLFMIELKRAIYVRFKESECVWNK